MQGKPREWRHRKKRSCVPTAGDAKSGEVPTGYSDAVVTWGAEKDERCGERRRP